MLIARSPRPKGAILPLCFPLVACAVTAPGQGIARVLSGAGGTVGFGKWPDLFVAARIVVRDIVRASFLRRLGRSALRLVAALNLLDPLTAHLAETTLGLGNISVSPRTLFLRLVASSLLFRAGAWPNRQSAGYTPTQPDLRPATCGLAAKAAEAAICGAALLPLISIVGIDLIAIAVIGGALGVGIGLGPRPIAANLVSGMIPMLEDQLTVGDFVAPGVGEQERPVQMTARAVVLETFDGRRITVPNDHFITTRAVKVSDEVGPNRYEAHSAPVLDVDSTRVTRNAETAVGAFPVLRPVPEAAGEVLHTGKRGPGFEMTLCAKGLDDGANAYMGPALPAIRQTREAEGIGMSFRRDAA